ncbi:MAG: efflux RND transporter periplasmic adaptor subunit [Xanthobacteraceae bacterium]|nr:efflux RND transporter periplasmic adaptor subunit [Xanthobacteraceae bacterium]
MASVGRTMKAAVAIAAAGLFGGLYFAGFLGGVTKSGLDIAATRANAQGGDPAEAGVMPGPAIIELNDKQLASVKVERVDEREFPLEKSAVGTIDFNEEMLTQVFTPYQGRIIGLFAKVGDEVKKGQTLFTIDSPDLLAADSNLIAAAGVLDLTTRNLARLRKLYETRAVSQHDVEQAVSDQQTAEGALRAGRDAVRIFGKSEAEIDQIVKERKADPTLVVPSPISGRITARNAAPGLFAQPGSAPAPFTVADISTMWMLANVAERDVPAFHIGQEVKVSVVSYPGKIFEGRISTIDSMVDPNSRRLLVRSEIADPEHALRSGMFATYVIRVGDPVRSPAVPLDGVVREGDGTMTVWVTTDRRRFTQRTVKTGIQKDGFRQIHEGLRPGELVAGEGAVFLSNMLVIGQAGG